MLTSCGCKINDIQPFLLVLSNNFVIIISLYHLFTPTAVSVTAGNGDVDFEGQFEMDLAVS